MPQKKCKYFAHKNSSNSAKFARFQQNLDKVFKSSKNQQSSSPLPLLLYLSSFSFFAKSSDPVSARCGVYYTRPLKRVTARASQRKPKLLVFQARNETVLCHAALESQLVIESTFVWNFFKGSWLPVRKKKKKKIPKVWNRITSFFFFSNPPWFSSFPSRAFYFTRSKLTSDIYTLLFFSKIETS